MSLVLRFTASVPSNALTLKITDCTSVYGPLNVGGWGTPNFAFGSALTATIGVSKRNIDGTWQTQTTVDVFDILPSQAGGYVGILAEDAGLGDTVPDCVLRLIYNVTGTDSGTPYNISTTIYQGFTPVIDSYRLNLAKDVSACNCACEALTERFNCFSGYYRLLCSAKQCGDLNGIVKYIDILTTLIGNNCGGGCNN